MDNKSRIGASSRVLVKKERRSSYSSAPSNLGKYGGVMPSNVTSTTNASVPSQVVVKEEERSSYFPVPCQLVETYGGVMPSKVTLTTDESEKSWKLSIEKFDSEYFFTDGWKEFEEEVDLESRKFLIYKPVASSKQNGKKKISGNVHGTTSSSLNENRSTGSDDEKRLSFSKDMKKYHQYRLDIPGAFVRSTGICEKDIIILKNVEGKVWPVNVTKRAAVFSLCGGWIDFVADNKVMLGSKISFVWLSKSTILTQILKVGTSKQLVINSTSRRGKQMELLELSDSSRLDGENDYEDDSSWEHHVGKKWNFTKVLKKINAHSLDFPVSFSMVIGRKTSGEIKVMDVEGRMWPVIYNRRSSFRLTAGWIDFLVANKAGVGSTVVFESLPNCNSVVEARVMDAKINPKDVFVKKPRGRPSLHAPPLSCP